MRSYKLDDFDFELPQNRIATAPLSPRDHSRLFVLEKNGCKKSHHQFFEIGQFLQKGDVLVLNDSHVFPARLYTRKKTGGMVELLFLQHLQDSVLGTQYWEVMLKGSHIKENTTLFIDETTTLTIEKKYSDRTYLVSYEGNEQSFFAMLEKHGKTPIPPYIKESPLSEKDIRRSYQTVFSRVSGSVAAPTAGLHFTKNLLENLQSQGIIITSVTLHVGAGTFLPVTTSIQNHHMHSEYAEISSETAAIINAAKKEKRRVIAVGTTSVRTLESFAQNGFVEAGKKATNIFITPGYSFKIIDGMITNFHTPKSTLFMLVCAFSGISCMQQAYREAIEKKYRFYSFGDAMLLV